MKYQFITGSYTDDDSVILYCRNEKGEKRRIEVKGYYPYFYVPSTERIPDSKKIVSIDKGFKSVYGEDVTKITVKNPNDVKYFRDLFTMHYEADIRFVKRLLVDLGIKSGFECKKETVNYSDLKPIDMNIKPLVSIIDIECETPEDNRFPDSTKDAINAVTVYTKDTGYITIAVRDGEPELIQIGPEHQLLIVQNESTLLRQLNKFFYKVQPDVVMGWNVRFDTDYLYERARINNVTFKLSGMCKFDLLEAYKKIYHRGSNRLKDVVIQEGIVDTIQEFDKNQSKNDFFKFIEYNKHDVEYCVKIDKKFKLLDFFWMMKNIAGIEDLESTLYNSNLVDALIFRLYKDKYVLPSKPASIVNGDEDEDEERYEGAIVFDAPRGVFDNVGTFDMSKYYPSIILAYNLSPENNGMLGNLVRYIISEREKLDSILESLTPGTDEYNDYKNMRDAFKFFLNSIYGYFGSPASRLYNRAIAEKITEVGRNGLIFLRKSIEERGERVIYGDTDSVMVEMKENPHDIEDYLNNKLVEFCKNEGVAPLLKLKFEKTFKRMLFTGVKKRYAGWMIKKGEKDTDDISVTGFEYVRRDSCKITKDIQMMMFKKILKGDSQDIVDEIKKVIEEIRNGKLPIDDISIPKTLNKSLDKYKMIPDYVRGSLYMNKNFNTNIRGGDTIKMLYIKSVKDIPKTDIICYIDIKDVPMNNITVDYEKHIDKTILMKTREVLDVIGINADKVFSKQKSLKSFDEVF
jgi:DNA polymerase I